MIALISRFLISLLPFSAKLPRSDIDPKLRITPNICPPKLRVKYLRFDFCSARYLPHFSMEGEDAAAFLRQHKDRKKVATNVDFVSASIDTENQSGNRNIEQNVKKSPTMRNNFLDRDKLFNDRDKYIIIKKADMI